MTTPAAWTPVPRVKPFEDQRVVPHLPRRGLGFDGLFQVGILLGGQQQRQRLGGLDGDHLREPVAVAVAHAQHAANVLEHGLGRQRAERHDLADRARARTSARTYSMTSPRRSMQKSMSMSGGLTRSGLRNRSKISPKRNGSMSVMPRMYATSEPAADPRPGPTGMPFWSRVVR